MDAGSSLRVGQAHTYLYEGLQPIKGSVQGYYHCFKLSSGFMLDVATTDICNAVFSSSIKMLNACIAGCPNTTAPAPTAPPVEPTHVYVCGVDYFDAIQGCSTNVGCPFGDGCARGETCFAVPCADCCDAPATIVAAITTGVSAAVKP
jgi:hypothetical protein